MEDGEEGGQGVPESNDTGGGGRDRTEEESLPSELLEGSARKRPKLMADEVREAISVAVEVWTKTANTTAHAGCDSSGVSGASVRVNDKEQLLVILRALKLPPLMVVQTLDAIKVDVELFMFMNTEERMELIAARLGKPKDSLFPV